MSVTYTATNELPLNHHRQCDHCGRVFPVYYHAFVKGEASTAKLIPGSDFLQHVITGNAPLGAEGKAQYEAAMGSLDVLSEQRHLRHFQRCTHCGKYDNASLAWMRQSYDNYRRYCHAMIGIVGGGCLLLVGWCAWERSRDAEFPLLIFSIITLLVFMVTYLFKQPLSAARFRQKVDQANDPQNTQQWLKCWNRKSPSLIESLRTSERFREGLWESLNNLQKYLDPKYGLINKSPLPPVHECVCLDDQGGVISKAKEKFAQDGQSQLVPETQNPPK